MQDDMSEVRLAGERVYSGRAVTLEVDRVRLANGSESIREVIRHPGAAVILPVTDDGRVLMVRQFRYPVAEPLLELPAGTLEPDEDPRECAARELVEETGWRAASLHDLGWFFSTPGFTDERLYGVLATGLSRVATGPAGDDDESIEVVELSLEELLRLTRDGEIHDGKSLATILLAHLQGLI
jgi:ADP-ribose pyrophosphatase